MKKVLFTLIFVAINLFISTSPSEAACIEGGGMNVRDCFFNTSAVSPAGRDAFSTPGGVINLLLPNIIVVSGLIFFALILFGGFKMITSAGSNPSSQDMAKAQNYLTYGLIGFIVVIGSYFIVQIISYIILGNNQLLNSPIL